MDDAEVVLEVEAASATDVNEAAELAEVEVVASACSSRVVWNATTSESFFREAPIRVERVGGARRICRAIQQNRRAVWKS